MNLKDLMAMVKELYLLYTMDQQVKLEQIHRKQKFGSRKEQTIFQWSKLLNDGIIALLPQIMFLSHLEG